MPHKIIDKQVICIFDNSYIAYKGGTLYSSHDLKIFTRLCKIPIKTSYYILSKFRFSSRLFRLYPRAVCKLNETEFIFAFLGQIYCVNIFNGTIISEHHFPSPMRAPLSFTKIENIVGFDNCIVYGEYHSNPKKGEMSVYARKDGIWKAVLKFSASKILHIHSLCADKTRNRVLILTGDSDHECGIYEAKNNFKLLNPLLTGNQMYRACVAFPTENGIIYATDTPLYSNAIFEYCENGTLTKLYDMPGPVIFGTTFFRDNRTFYIFSTSVEPDSQIKGWKYLLTYRLGPGVKERFSNIIIGNPVDGFQNILKLKKDILPMTLFQFGNASFCVDTKSNPFILPQSVGGLDGKTIIL